MPDTQNTQNTELTLQQVADELGVHYMTAYRYVRIGMLPASKQGRSWVVHQDDFEAFQAQSDEPTARGDADWEGRLLNRLLAKDEAGAWSVVEAALASGLSPTGVYTEMITPSLARIGSLWESGDITVADEHAAAHIAGRIIARIGPKMTSRGVRRGTVVLGSTSTDLHDLPITILADMLRAERFDVIDLGANLPPESFAAAVAQSDSVVAAAIGVTIAGQENAISETVAAIRRVSDAPLLIGGAGIDADTAIELGASVSARTGDEAVAAINALVAAN